VLLFAEEKLWPTPDTSGFTNRGSLKMLAEKTENPGEFAGMAYRAAAKKKDKLWPTPMASDAEKNSRGNDKYIPGAVWATPTANDAKNSLTESQRGRGTLTAHVVESLWPTPRCNTGPSKDKKHMSLDGSVTLWPTPRTAGMCGGIEEARKMGAGNGGQLNPDWVEALMGYPIGWTDIASESDMKTNYPEAWLNGTWEDGIPRVASGVKNRGSRLKCLGNAVVPQIPEMILKLIAKALTLAVTGA
jgi:hypothetical protein